MPTKRIKYPQCLKLIPKNETDHYNNCEKTFCLECLTDYEELVFCRNCEKQ